MNKQYIQALYQYNAWSNVKILNAASNITQEQFVAPAAFPHGSLRGTLVHALFAEWIWRNRWEGTSSASIWKPENFPTLEDLRARWIIETPRLIDFVTNVTEELLCSKIKYVSTEGFPHERVLWECMLHLINHGTQHKTEA